MRAAEMKKRPDFPLLRQTDVPCASHMQMPRWLFTDPRCADLSLDAKVAYTFLLSRFQLSRRNGWTNDQGEVFVIFPRKELAKELRICEKRATAAFQALAERGLIWEKRCGRGGANQIYLARVQPQDGAETAASALEEVSHGAEAPAPEEASLSAEAPAPALEEVPHGMEVSAPAPAERKSRAGDPSQEPQNTPFQNRPSCGSRAAESAVPEPSNLRPSYKEPSNTKLQLKHCTIQ